MRNSGSQVPPEAGLADGNSFRTVVVFSCLLTFGLGKLEHPEVSVSRARDESVQISCKASINSFKSVAIHWYRQKPKQGLEYLLYVMATPTQIPLDKKYKKMEASKNSSASTSTLTIYSLEEEDEAIYYCSYGQSTAFELPESPTQEPSPSPVFQPTSCSAWAATCRSAAGNTCALPPHSTSSTAFQSRVWNLLCKGSSRSYIAIEVWINNVPY